MVYLIKYLKKNHRDWCDYKTFEELDLIKLIQEIQNQFNNRETKLRVFELIEMINDDETLSYFHRLSQED